MKHLYQFCILLSFFLMSLGFRSYSVLAETQPIKVMTTFYPIYTFTKAVVGNTGDVTMLIGPGMEIHDFEPSTKTMIELEKTDDFIYLDPSMETWVAQLEKTNSSRKTNMIKASGEMILATSQESPEEHQKEEHVHEVDPHLWLSPRRAIQLVENIKDSLVKAHPDLASQFEQNAAQYLKQLKELDKDYQVAFSQAKQKSFVTQHAAFTYLALDYQLQQIAITGISADIEPSAKHLIQLIDYVKKYEIKYIYFEKSASKNLARTLASEANLNIAVLNPLESLTQEEIKKGQDYFSVMRANLKALRLTTDRASKTVEDEKD
ncbi:metal ABC transporter substrate-binding protein [Streptococcus sp. sy018]|uniref:metal ABC transporter substrate-binding protein n=1 Tax=Streptococcus sp. sy018 TaxID=2600147 RepID=UPI0011B5E130|nr:metal ABC transporter substrate-binding protein [Streptococcus sp. sy018]TWS95388.1 zinc ABC transporter substrate-binding protein [Streptococcus sp. sy018]